MGSTDLEFLLIEIWNSFNKNIGLMIMNHPEVKLIQDCYRQLTGNNIFLNISEEFTTSYKSTISEL